MPSITGSLFILLCYRCLDCVVSDGRGIDELERIWSEVARPDRGFTWRDRKTMKVLNHDSLCSAWDLNQVLPGYKSRIEHYTNQLSPLFWMRLKGIGPVEEELSRWNFIVNEYEMKMCTGKMMTMRISRGADTKSRGNWKHFLPIVPLWNDRRILFCNAHSRSRDSTIGIATGYGLEDWGVGVRVPVGSRIFSSSHRPGTPWGSSSLLFNSYCGLFPLG
jgi:hypothetical protein